jgi:hypothetical protein
VRAGERDQFVDSHRRRAERVDDPSPVTESLEILA